MSNKNKEILLGQLHDMEDFAELKKYKIPPIYLLGGSGCIVGEYIKRATVDFDVIDMNYPSQSARFFRLLEKVDYLDLYQITIDLDFKKRAKKLSEFKYLDIYVLSKEDIIVTKIGRYGEKDINDIRELLKNSDKSLILKLIDNVNQRHNIGEKLKEVFLKNVKLFRRDFDV